MNHLIALLATRRIELVGEREVMPGPDWTQEVDPRLSAANLVVMLLSADLLGSGYYAGAEMRQILERHRGGKVSLLAIFVRYVDVEGLYFSMIRTLPGGGKPVIAHEDHDEAWWEVVQAIRQLAGRY
jgi:hypothetical protein